MQLELSLWFQRMLYGCPDLIYESSLLKLWQLRLEKSYVYVMISAYVMIGKEGILQRIGVCAFGQSGVAVSNSKLVTLHN